MNHIKDIIKDASKTTDEIIFQFIGKQNDHVFNEQDKIHVRIMAVLQLAHNRELLEYVMRHKVKEVIKYDKDKNVVYYKLKFIKERRNHRGDA